MSRLGIDGLGVFTSVGMNLAQTMGSFRTGLEFFEDLEFFGSDGEPVVGAPTRVTEGVLGLDRLVAMASFALRECAGAEDANAPALPVVLCLPEESDAVVPWDRLLSLLEETTQVRIDRTRSCAVRQGRAGLAEALRTAEALLASGAVPGCYVGGLDSLLLRPRLEALHAAGRLKSSNRPDGVIPGEAAAFARLTARPRPDAFAVVAGIGSTEEPANLRSGQPNTAVSLTRAARAALTEAAQNPSGLGLIATDYTGERYGMQEGALALTRLKIDAPEPLEVWTPAFSVGDTGAATGALSLAYLAFRHSVRAIRGQATLWLGASDGAARGAVVLTEARHG